MQSILFFLSSFLIVLSPAVTAAQDAGPFMKHGNSSIAMPHYYALARQAILQRPDNFRFDSFRGRYYGTQLYDPLAKAAKTRLIDLAYHIENETDPEKEKSLREDYAAHLAAHLANIDVVMQAYSMSLEDPDLGDPELLLWMRNGLLQSVVKSGTGDSLTQAYDVITLGEEALLLQHLNLKILDTIAAESGGTYYNMHDVQDPRTGQTYTVFVNVTMPMRYLVQKQGELGSGILIRRQ